MIIVSREFTLKSVKKIFYSSFKLKREAANAQKLRDINYALTVIKVSQSDDLISSSQFNEASTKLYENGPIVLI